MLMRYAKITKESTGQSKPGEFHNECAENIGKYRRFRHK